MYCQNCGQEIDDKAVICVHCGVATGKPVPTADNTGKSWVAALLLCIFLGGFGAHRFYVGKTGSGITMLLITLLLGWIGIGIFICGVWVLVDLINICLNTFKTADGKPLQK